MAVKSVTVLIPTSGRSPALAVTLTGLFFQDFTDFDIVISDQSEDDDIMADDSIRTAIRLLSRKGHDVQTYKNLPRCGMAQQRQSLLDRVKTPYSLFIDDDILLEPYVIGLMMKALQSEDAGFVGQAVIGLSYAEDRRPAEQRIEVWDGPVVPETVLPRSKEWQRHVLHNAANVLHVQERLGASPERPVKYKIAWVGGCVLYDTEKLRSAGGFGFWHELPADHCGEDVLVQLRVMKRYGGFGLLPSGAYHQENPTTVRDRRVNAPEVLDI